VRIVVHAPTLTGAASDRVAAAVLAAVRAEIRRLDDGGEADAGNGAVGADERAS
jgi:hypothetical protein